MPGGGCRGEWWRMAGNGKDVWMRVGRCFAYCVGAQALLAAPALIWPGYLDTPVGVVLMLPFLSIYAAHALGIPGLLENQGACGWGWCAPSVFGWLFFAVLWLGLNWGLARALAALGGTQGEPKDKEEHP